ncbi:MAG: NAD-dependent epimerase/dehydratase family protein [Acidobacteriota bacterium]
MRTNQPVCVTGASGFVAAHIVRELLERGYRVRGTVRNAVQAGKYGFLTSLPGAGERLELVGADLLTAGAYDAAVAGCDIVIHTASPYLVNVADPQRDLVDPAVKGTLNVLQSARSAGVRRVVLTSSIAAICDEPVEGKVLTEADWNERSSLERNPYYFSKVSAERAAWKFVDERAAGFDLVAINPFMVVGPSIGPGLNVSNAIFRDLLTGVFPAIMNLAWGFVDVRDVATAHVAAIEHVDATGRYICAGDVLTMKEVIAILRDAGYGAGSKLPRLPLTSPIGDLAIKLLSYTQPRGSGSYLRTHVGKVMRYDNGKIRRDLGVHFRPARESLLAAVADLVRWGHVKPPLQGPSREPPSATASTP